MKKTSFILLFSLLSAFTAYSQIYLCKGGSISFFSETPIENIDAHSTNLNSILNTSTGEVVFMVPITSFKFAKALMQEHFNEKYLESDKFPSATFKGKINETIDYTKDGTYPITATGKLTVHGVEKERTEKGTLTIKNGVISIETSFKVLVKDHNVEIPTLVMQNIAEAVLVKINATYAAYKK